MHSSAKVFHVMHMQYNVSHRLSIQAAILKGCCHNSLIEGVLEKEHCRTLRSFGCNHPGQPRTQQQQQYLAQMKPLAAALLTTQEL